MFGKLVIGLFVAANIVTLAFGAYHPGPAYHARQQKGGGLTVIEANEKKVEGVYQGSTGSIRFLSEVTNSDRSVIVTSAEGKPIIITNKPGHSSLMTMTMGNSKFVAAMNEPGRGLPKYTDYVVPEVFHNHIETAARQNRIPRAIMQYLDAKSANATRQKAVEDLVSRGEADLIVEAAKALGNAGVTGLESPAAQQFYVLAMRLGKVEDRIMRSQAESLPLHTQELFSTHQQKRQTCSECTTGRCPYYGDRSNNCFGMCGLRCSCWSWVCGDCCVHQGCVDHDLCCASEGYWSSECLAPSDFSCSSYSC